MFESGDQISFFEMDEAERTKARWQRIYELWLAMPNEIFMADGTAERAGMYGKHAYMTELWMITRSIHHTCAGMPENYKCWLNTCEPAEYWVLTQKGDVESGRHIKLCPYCGARLIDGRGDITIYKDQRRHHCFPTEV